MGTDLGDLVALLRAAAPELSGERAIVVATQLQRDLGGSYLKKAPAEGKALRLGYALAAGGSLAQAFADLGVSRATGFRYLRRKWPRR